MEEENMDHKKDIQLQFGLNANSYVNSQIHKKGADLQILIKMASTSGQEKLLDIATGGGHTANGFAPFVKNVTALDITAEMLAAAETFVKGNGHQNVEFIQGDAENLPFPEESFDIVTCRIAPHHFPNVNEFVNEAFRVLKPGGQFLLDDNVAPEDDGFDQFYNHIEKIRDYSHFRAWKKSEWVKMLELAHFEIIEWHRFEKNFLFDSWCDRLKLPQTEKENLNRLMINATDQIKAKFRIVQNEQMVSSFQGESIILKAVKR